MYMKLLHNLFPRIKKGEGFQIGRKLEVFSGTLWSSVAIANCLRWVPQMCNLTVVLRCRLTGICLRGTKCLTWLTLATAADEAKTAFLLLWLGETLQFLLVVVVVQVPFHGISLPSLPSISRKMDVVLPKVFNLVLYKSHS